MPLRTSILGAGHVGMSLLCDVALRADPKEVAVRLFSFAPRDLPTRINFHEVLSQSVENVDIGGLVDVSGMAEGPIPAWVRESDVIVLAVPDIATLRVRTIERLLAADAIDGKTIVFCRGGQAGMPFWANRINEDRRLQQADYVLIEDSFYGTRRSDEVIRCKRKLRLNAALWSTRQDRTKARLRALFPGCPAHGLESWPEFRFKDPLELLFDPLGYIIHVAVAFYGPNVVRTIHGETYTHYVDGIDRTLAQQLQALDNERVRLATAFGVRAETFPQIIHRQYGLPILDDFYDMMQSCRSIYKSRSCSDLPNLLGSRYVYEDMPPLFTMQHLADIAGIDLPETRAFGKQVCELIRGCGLNEEALMIYRRCFSNPGFRSGFKDIMSSPFVPELATEN